jgi:hypothetical protein
MVTEYITKTFNTGKKELFILDSDNGHLFKRDYNLFLGVLKGSLSSKQVMLNIHGSGAENLYDNKNIWTGEFIVLKDKFNPSLISSVPKPDERLIAYHPESHKYFNTSPVIIILEDSKLIACSESLYARCKFELEGIIQNCRQQQITHEMSFSYS